MLRKTFLLLITPLIFFGQTQNQEIQAFKNPPTVDELKNAERACIKEKTELEKWYEKERKTPHLDIDDDEWEDRLNDDYFYELEQIEGSIQAIETYLMLQEVRARDEVGEEVSFETLPWPSTGGLTVVCDTFGVQFWYDNWISEGLDDPSEAGYYENWYAVFNILPRYSILSYSETGFFLPLYIQGCSYDQKKEKLSCGGQEIKIDEEYKIKSLQTEPGERGNGIIFTTPTIQ